MLTIFFGLEKYYVPMGNKTVLFQHDNKVTVFDIETLTLMSTMLVVFRLLETVFLYKITLQLQYAHSKLHLLPIWWEKQDRYIVFEREWYKEPSIYFDRIRSSRKLNIFWQLSLISILSFFFLFFLSHSSTYRIL